MDGGEVPDAAALLALGLPPGRCALVGDRLETDISMAKAVGMTSVLTLTGVTRWSDLGGSPCRPDHVIESLAALPTLDAELNKR